MKRKRPGEDGPAICELCREPEPTPGDFITRDGFLVCRDCGDRNGPTLERMRIESDEAGR
jgi:hypothetical protein